ncbi:hypothetical protein M3J09_009929 [Ascochyta lentis]
MLVPILALAALAFATSLALQSVVLFPLTPSPRSCPSPAGTARQMVSTASEACTRAARLSCPPRPLPSPKKQPLLTAPAACSTATI